MNNIQKAILSGIICNMIVWYEFTLFGILTDTIINVFFPSEDHYLGALKFLGVFAVGFAFRPIGAVIFGYMGDKCGRRKTLLTSVVLISISSGIMGIIPGYKEVGLLSPILLVFCRIVQGMTAGGETSINTAFTIEHSKDKKNLGFLGSMKPFSGGLGSLLCIIMVLICKKVTGENYEIWGWKLLFYFCFFMGIVGFLTRYILEESLAYKANKHADNLAHSPFLELIRSYKRPLIISINLGIAQNAITYAALMFYNISIKELVILSINVKDLMRIVVQIVFAASAVLFAILSDKVGRNRVMIPVLIMLSLVGTCVLPLLSSVNHYVVIITYLLITIPIGASFGMYGSIVCELFPTKVRCTGVSLANNISAGIFGGLSPSICMWLIEKTETKIAAGIYLTICALISLISVLQIKAKDRKVDW
uniref:Proline/betaine transporter n=1 Tax=Wolbachia endosymbiont of Aleurodicus dispersus TaxID=1288877 RepID=A0A3B0JHR1_9RICK